MLKKLRYIFLSIVFLFPIMQLSCAHARPPKPGPHFVWVVPHTNPAGVVVRGHWKYVGPVGSEKTWIPGHYNANGVWVLGRWKPLGKAPRRSAVWVRGHRGPHGRWIRGRWR